VIGAQKCGTSGLHYYLGLHSEIAMSRPKELNFFIRERNWDRGIDWYRRHFDPRSRVRGESSPNYTTYPHHQGIPERMHRVVPDVKLILLVRDPIERIAAQWVHNYAKRREKGDLAATLAHPETTYLLRSRYHMQLSRFLEHYALSQVLVLDQDDLRHRRRQTLRRVFEFLGVDPEFEHPGFGREQHLTERKYRGTRLGLDLGRWLAARGYQPRRLKGLWVLATRPFRRPIERPRVREALAPDVIELLHEDAERLRELTGRDFAHWSV
jgi:hypothetical protein